MSADRPRPMRPRTRLCIKSGRRTADPRHASGAGPEPLVGSEAWSALPGWLMHSPCLIFRGGRGFPAEVSRGSAVRLSAEGARASRLPSGIARREVQACNGKRPARGEGRIRESWRRPWLSIKLPPFPRQRRFSSNSFRCPAGTGRSSACDHRRPSSPRSLPRPPQPQCPPPGSGCSQRFPPRRPPSARPRPGAFG